MEGMAKFIGLLAALMLPAVALAIPALQVDCFEDGSRCDYVDGEEQSLIATQTNFTITAMATPNGRLSDDEILTNEEIQSNTFFLAVALTGVTEGTVLSSLGSLTIDGVSTLISDLGFVWGTPPGTDPEIPGHSIYETWYMMLEFNFTANPNCDTVNVQTLDVGETLGSYCVDFTFDMSGLAEGVQLHFDLLGYNDKGKLVVAPFSHDAGTQVPEPGTLSLLGLGLLMIGFSRRKLKGAGSRTDAAT